MSTLLGLSFDMEASPSILLKAPPRHVYHHHQPFGWGIAWYPSEDQAAVVIKDPTTVEDNATTLMLKDWKRFRSTLFLCHIRGAAKRRTQQDTHPFSQSYARRTWLMAHNGDLRPGYAEALALGEAPRFEPIGRTDSEHALCWLLSQIAACGARTLADVGWVRLWGWLLEINAQGTANLLLSDGQDLVAWRDTGGCNTLAWTVRRPPHAPGARRLESDALVLDYDDPVNPFPTLAVVSSEPLSADGWTHLEPGQLLVFRRGALIWDNSDANQVHLTGYVPPPSGSRHAVEPEVAPAARTLRVTHETLYTYERPVELSQQLLRLRPVQDRHQRVVDYTLRVEPDGVRAEDMEDVFGNTMTRLDIESPYTRLRFISESTVIVQPITRLTHPFSNTRDTLPLVWMPWHREMMHPYLLPPELPVTHLRALSDYAMSFAERQGFDLVETLLDMNQTIAREYTYAPGTTHLETTPFEVFAQRRGVCQDFANLLICLARLLNIPARYRVGYLHTGSSYANTAQAEASHAWVELYLPLIGWRGFDPTNGCLAGPDHIRVACGRNYRDATPTSGTIYRGGAGERLTVQVRVEEIPTPLSGA